MDFYAKILDEQLHQTVYQMAYVDALAEFGIYVLPKSAPAYTDETFDFKYGSKIHGWPTKEDTDFLLNHFDTFITNLKAIYNIYAEDHKFLKLLEKIL